MFHRAADVQELNLTLHANTELQLLHYSTNIYTTLISNYVTKLDLNVHVSIKLEPFEHICDHDIQLILMRTSFKSTSTLIIKTIVVFGEL